METLPISSVALADERIFKAAQSLSSRAEEIANCSTRISDWLTHEFDVRKRTNALKRPETMTVDAFIEAVRESLPKKRKLSASEIAELKREYKTTIEPARKLSVEKLVLEKNLSNFVSEAYGLTSDDVDLMWKTKPPRMPFAPSGFVPEGEDESEEEEEA